MTVVVHSRLGCVCDNSLSLSSFRARGGKRVKGICLTDDTRSQPVSLSVEMTAGEAEMTSTTAAAGGKNFASFASPEYFLQRG